MTDELETWDREHYIADGGDPLLFYVVYGTVDATVALSRSKYRSNGCPDGVELTRYGYDRHSDVIDGFREGYLWDEFVSEQPQLASTVAETDQCLALRGVPMDSTSLNYFRDTIGLIAYLIDNGGCVVYDPFTFRWWSPKQWNAEAFMPAAPLPRHHTAILVSDDEGSTNNKWFHTRGMRKFGRPDISVRNVTPEYEPAIIDLCGRLIEHQAFGHVIAEGEEVTMKSLPTGGTLHHAGNLEDPDFNNVHVEYKWPEST